MALDLPPEPWHSFFLDIDEALQQSVVLHCLGGFVIAMLYGLPRPTAEIHRVIKDDLLRFVRLDPMARDVANIRFIQFPAEMSIEIR